MDNFRLILDGTNEGSVNMSRDYAMLKNCRTFAIPTLRLYQWDPVAVTIGYFQIADEETDRTACENDGISVIRRITGGGAVFHQYEITYSIVFPLPHEKIPGSILESYRILTEPFVASLRELGLNAEFSPVNDITVDGKKISGNAQTRREGSLLQHGTILLKVDSSAMFKYLKVPQKKIESKGNSRPASRVTSLEAEVGAEALSPDFTKKLNMIFAEKFGTIFKMEAVEMPLSDYEKELASGLRNEFFSNKEWNFKR